MANLGRKVGATLTTLGIATIPAIAEGFSEYQVTQPGTYVEEAQPKNNPTIILSFDYTSPVTNEPTGEDATRNYALFSDGSVAMIDPETNKPVHKFLMNDEDGTWFYDANKNNEIDTADEPMNPLYGANFTNKIKNALILAKDELAKNGRENRGLLETIALAEDRLANAEENNQEYLAQIASLNQDLQTKSQTQSDSYETASNQTPTSITTYSPDGGVSGPNGEILEEVKSIVSTPRSKAVIPAGTPEPKKARVRFGLDVMGRFNTSGNQNTIFMGGPSLTIGNDYVGTTISALFGGAQDIIISEKRVGPFTSGIYGEGNIEQQNLTSVGGALDFYFGFEKFHGVLGFGVQQENWTEKTIEGTFNADGTPRTAEPPIYNFKKLTTANFRAGLEFMLNKNLGIGPLASFDIKGKRISLGLRTRY
jgi:hypothetical protein